jgi:hypothetical protein
LWADGAAHVQQAHVDGVAGYPHGVVLMVCGATRCGPGVRFRGARTN